MGMSSSQARMLTLTARMHDIEYKAQRIEAKKLQLANDSAHAYEEYLNALDAKKIQYKSINKDGSITFRDANCDILQNGCVPSWTGESSTKTLFLQRQDGTILVTPTVAREYGIDDESINEEMDTYIANKTGEELSTREVVKDYIYETDENDVISVSVEENHLDIVPISGDLYQKAVANKVGDYIINCDCLQIQGEQDKEVTGDYTINASNIDDFTTIEEGKTYIVEDAAGLKKLADLSATNSTQGVNIILNPENGVINLRGITWSGFKNFAGNFDGNYCTIENLKGSNGLIDTADGSVNVQNVFLKNVNINGGRRTGGIIGSNLRGNSQIISPAPTYTTAELPYTVDINNCTVTGNITGDWHSGGIMGDGNDNPYANITITNCNADIDYTAKDTDPSSFNCTCHGGILGHGSGRIVITDCQSTGSMHANAGDTATHIGGIIGHNCDSSSSTKNCFITNCKTNMDVSGSDKIGGVLGYSEIPENYELTDVIFDSHGNTLNACGNGSGTGLPFKEVVTVPSVNEDYSGGVFSNLKAALMKCTNGDMEGVTDQGIKDYIASLKTGTNGDINIANLNDYLYNYLKNQGGTTPSLAQTILSDVKNGNTTSISSLPSTYTAETYMVEYSTKSDAWSTRRGQYSIPDVETMAKEVYYLSKKSGYEVDLSAIETWFGNYDINDVQDKQYLANLNDIIVTKDVSSIMSLISTNSKYTGTDAYPIDKYDIVFADYVEPRVKFRTTAEAVTDEETYWDTSIPSVANAMAMWILYHKCGIEVLKDGMETNSAYLTNVLESGFAVLTTFDPSKINKIFDLDADYVAGLSNHEFNKILGIENTSVSIETCLQEVSDEKDLKKAEAKYEADMRAIDRKDRKYDTELAACETERSAIKLELDTLKTVAKDNVDRTFKLFS